MRKLALVSLSALLLVFVAGRIRRALASPEQALRWQLEDMLDGFNAPRVGPMIGGFHTDFRDESSGIGREDLKSALAYLVLTHKDPATKDWNLEVELPDESISIEMAEDQKRATVRVTPTFFITHGDARDVWWSAGATADFVHVDGRWRCLRTRGVNHAQRPE
jgi:hypothetical protein